VDLNFLPLESIDEKFLKNDITGSAFCLAEDCGPSSQSNRSQRSIASSSDDRLYSILYNTAALRFFNEFCLQEYSIENVLFWIEAEIYRSIVNEDQRKIYAKYLYFHYLKLESPLCLNVDNEVREAIAKQYSEDPSPELFDDVQGLIYILIKQRAYPRFERSDFFKRFLKFKTEGK
jgi:hypothetical protein